MPRKFKEKDIEVVWDAVHSKMLRRKQISEMMNLPPEIVEGLYAAGERRNRRRKQLERHIAERVEERRFQRAKGIYSNRSPYGIAQPGN